MNHTRYRRYIVNSPGVGPAVRQHIAVGEEEVNFDALFKTLREMDFASRIFTMGGETTIIFSLFCYPEKCAIRL